MKISKKQIVIGLIVTVGIGLISRVDTTVLSDISGALFLMFYILSMLMASALMGSLAARNLYHDKQNKMYIDNAKKLELFENNNRFDVKFSSEVVSLHEEITANEEKIKKLQRSK